MIVAHAREFVDPEQFLAALNLLLGEQLGDLAPDHVVHEHRLVHIFKSPGADVPGVAENRDAVGEAKDVFKAVGNEDDGRALRAQFAGNGVKIFALSFGQCGGGLVHDEYLRVHGQRLGDLDQLLLGDGERTYRRRGAEIRAHGVEQFFCLPVGARPVDERAALKLVADEYILRHGQIRIGSRVLVDGGDAILLGDDGVAHDHLLALENDLAAVRLMHAGQRLDERGLARAVLADEGVYLSGAQVELHAVQSLDAREYLGDILHFQQVFRHGGAPQHGFYHIIDYILPRRQAKSMSELKMDVPNLKMCTLLL